MSISRSIVDAVRSLDPPGRFLEKNQETGLWSDIGDKKAIEKVRHQVVPLNFEHFRSVSKRHTWGSL